jgi:hypothetical protein
LNGNDVSAEVGVAIIATVRCRSIQVSLAFYAGDT